MIQYLANGNVVIQASLNDLCVCEPTNQIVQIFRHSHGEIHKISQFMRDILKIHIYQYNLYIYVSTCIVSHSSSINKIIYYIYHVLLYTTIKKRYMYMHMYIYTYAYVCMYVHLRRGCILNALTIIICVMIFENARLMRFKVLILSSALLYDNNN